MELKFLRSFAFLVLFFFSFHQLSFASPIAPTATTAQGIIHDPFFKILKSDPAFQMKELTQVQLDQIKAKLLSLTTEDIHFGQSAMYSVYELLKLRLPLASVPTLAQLTSLALFSDILTGVISPEFEGNLQFSAYTLKSLLNVYAVKTIGLKLTWSDLVKMVQSGYSVIANIEQRHFVLVTQISGQCSVVSDQCLVTFLENGYTRTKTATEFNAQWFSATLPGGSAASFGGGVALALDSSLQDTNLTTLYLNTKILKSSDLLKVKGAGWFKKLFRKIARFFQAVFNAVVNVIQKVVQAVTKFFTTTVGKIIGTIFLGPIGFQLLNFGLNSASYGLKGDFKGLMKYWGSNILTLASLAIQLIPGVGQILGGFMQFMGGFLNFAGSALGFMGNLLGGLLSFIPIAGPILGRVVSGVLNFAGGFLQGLGGSLIQQGRGLIQRSNSFFKDLKARGFEAVKDSFRNPLDLKPKISYQAELPDGVLPTRTPSGGFVFLDQIKDTAKIPIQTGTQKSTFDLLLKIVLDTARDAAIGAIEGQVDQLFSSSQTGIQGTRAPPINAPSAQVSDTSSNKSLSLKDPNRSQTPFSIYKSPFGQSYAFAYDGEGIPNELILQDNPLSYQIKKTSNGKYYFTELDEGEHVYIKVDDKTKEISFVERIQNWVTNAGEFFTQVGGALVELGRSTGEFFGRVQETVVGPIRHTFFPQLEINRLVQSGKFPDAIGFAAKRYEFNSGTYNPQRSEFLKNPDLAAFAEPSGNIVFGDRAFFDPNGSYVPTRLQSVGFHETIHAEWQFKANKVIFDPVTHNIMNRNLLEMEASQEAILKARGLGSSNVVKQQMIDYYDRNVREYNLTHPNKEPFWNRRPSSYRVNVMKR